MLWFFPTPGRWRARRKQCRGLRSNWWSWRFRLQIGRRTSRSLWAPPNSTIWIPGSLLLGKHLPGVCWKEPPLCFCLVPPVSRQGMPEKSVCGLPLCLQMVSGSYKRVPWGKCNMPAKVSTVLGGDGSENRQGLTPGGWLCSAGWCVLEWGRA